VWGRAGNSLIRYNCVVNVTVKELPPPTDGRCRTAAVRGAEKVRSVVSPQIRVTQTSIIPLRSVGGVLSCLTYALSPGG